MEGTKPRHVTVESTRTKTMAPPNIVQQPEPDTVLPQDNKKTKNQKKREPSDDVDIRDSPYFKIRALVHQLRPYFIEVLGTPDFRECKAATEIRTRMNHVMDLYKQMQTEGNKRGKKSEKSACGPQSAKRNEGGKEEHVDGLLRQEGGTQKDKHQPKQAPKEETVENKKLSPLDPVKSLEKKPVDGGRLQGSYIVGGSIPGWNFITFSNRRPSLYYGVTKESFRSSH